MEYKLSYFEHFYKFIDDVNIVIYFLKIYLYERGIDREKDKTRQDKKKSVKFVY